MNRIRLICLIGFYKALVGAVPTSGARVKDVPVKGATGVFGRLSGMVDGMKEVVGAIKATQFGTQVSVS